MAKTQATATIEPATVQPIVLDNKTDLEYLMQQKRSLDAQIKQARANRRGSDQERLAREIESQELTPNKSLSYDCWAFVARRMKLGQSPEEAKAAFMAIVGRLVDEGIADGNPNLKASSK